MDDYMQINMKIIASFIQIFKVFQLIVLVLWPMTLLFAWLSPLSWGCFFQLERSDKLTLLCYRQSERQAGEHTGVISSYWDKYFLQDLLREQNRSETVTSIHKVARNTTTNECS